MPKFNLTPSRANYYINPVTGQIEQRYVALMGDLVRSEGNTAPAHLHASFNAAIDAQNTAMREAIASPLTITLGDEFQGLLTSFVQALTAAQTLRLRLLADDIECRFVIGLVRLHTPLNRDRAWNMMGQGLSRAREKLDAKRAVTLYGFTLDDDPLMETLLDALGAGMTAIERSWTPQQRRYITAMLAGDDVATVARAHDVSVYSVYKVRAAGDYDAYLAQRHALQAAAAQLDHRYYLA